MNGQSAPHTPSPPSAAGGFFDSVRRLGIWRSPDRWAGGVAAGIAHRYGLDPLLVRGIFVVVTLFGGLGLVLYGVAWALLPEASDGRIHLEQAMRGWHFDIALAGAVAMVIIGLSRPVLWWTGSWWAVPWVLVVGVVVAVVLLSRDRAAATPGGRPSGAARPPYPAGPVPPAPGTTTPGPAADTATSPASAPADDPSATAAPGTDTTAALPGDDTSAAAGDTTTSLPDTDTTAALPRTDSTATLPGTGTTGAPGADTTSVEDPGSTTTHQGADALWGAGSSWDGGWGGTGDSAGGAGGGWGTGWDTPQPPPPPGPPVPGPGSRATSLVLALALLTAAGIALAHHQGALDANPWLVGGGAVLTILGAGVLVSGLRGRSQGGIGVLALVLAIVMVPSATAAAAVPGFARIGSGATMWAGDPTWAPRTAEDGEHGFSLVAGNLVVDLSQLEDDADITVPVSVTFGNLNLVVPDDAEVTVNASVGAGEIRGQLDDDWTGPRLPWTSGDNTLSNGVGISTALTQEGDGTGPRIVVDAEVSFGQLTIEETS